MARQANVSNQSVGGGSRGWAVIAPYIGSPNLFEGGVSGRRSSSSTSSGKNPFEKFLDVDDTNLNIDNMYPTAAHQALNMNTQFDIQLKILEQTTLPALMSAEPEQYANIINDYYSKRSEIKSNQSLVQSNISEEREKFNHNVAIVNDNFEKPYYDEYGRPVLGKKVDKDGKEVVAHYSYQDMHEMNSLMPMGSTQRLLQPVEPLSLMSIADDAISDMSISDRSVKTIRYAIDRKDMSTWKETIETLSTSDEKQAIEEAHIRMKQAIREDPEAQRALMAEYSKTLKGTELEALSNPTSENKESVYEKYNKWVDEYLFGVMNVSMSSKLTTGITREEISSEAFSQAVLGASNSNLSQLERAYIGETFGLRNWNSESDSKVTVAEITSKEGSGEVVLNAAIDAFGIGINNVSEWNKKYGFNTRVHSYVNVGTGSPSTAYINQDGIYRPTRMNTALGNLNVVSLANKNAVYMPTEDVYKDEDGNEIPTKNKNVFLQKTKEFEFDKPNAFSGIMQDEIIRNRTALIESKIEPVVSGLIENVEGALGVGSEEILNVETTKEGGVSITIDTSGFDNFGYDSEVIKGLTGKEHTKVNDIKFIWELGQEKIFINGREATGFGVMSGFPVSPMDSPISGTAPITEASQSLKDFYKKIESELTGRGLDKGSIIQEARKEYVNLYPDGAISLTPEEELRKGNVIDYNPPKGKWYLPFNVEVKSGDKYEILKTEKGIEYHTVKGKDISDKIKVDGDTYNIMEMLLPASEQMMKDVMSNDANVIRGSAPHVEKSIHSMSYDEENVSKKINEYLQ
jgi:hypothetical protein